MPMCAYCSAGFHTICLGPVEIDGYLMCCCDPEGSPIATARKQKDAADMKDPLSTGRKRAAIAKPITEGMVCEWAELSKAGGGVIPIVGCAGNPARHIHHGPDKDTTNNSDENLHRVCTNCHNRWHTLNDKFYGTRPPAGTPFVPLDHNWIKHDNETKATTEQIFDHEKWWWDSKSRSTPHVNTPEDSDIDGRVRADESGDSGDTAGETAGVF